MKKFNYPWFLKLQWSLEVYFEYVRRLNAIATENRVSHRQRICDIQLLLIDFSEALLEAEKSFLDVTQFGSNACFKATDVRVEHNSMGLYFAYYNN
jgi:hypothetical protein